MNAKYPEELCPNRHYTRLPDYDYSWLGAYFVTICTSSKKCLFGNVEKDSMKLNPYGKIVEFCWRDLPAHYGNITNDIFIVMPNHVHGIVIIREVKGLSDSKPDTTRKHSLSEIMRAFKTYSSRRINEYRKSPGTPVWQRGCYEHIIREESEYQQIGEYIMFNASKRQSDRENPDIKLSSAALHFEY